MEKKIIGIFVCMLLIAATVLPVAGNVKIEPVKEKQVRASDFKVGDMASLDNQYIKEVWNKKLGKPLDRQYEDWIVKAQQTTDGGYIAIGTTWPYGAGDFDAWLIKTDSNGNEDWNKTFGGSGEDFALGGQQTSDGGYILIGASVYDVYLIKTDSNGNQVWSKTFGKSAYPDYGYFVQQTSDSGYIITGITKSYGTGDNDLWLIKTNSNGNESWNKTFGGVYGDGGFVVREINDGYIMTGWKRPTPQQDAWLIKTDFNGNEVWSRTYGGNNDDSGHDVRKTTDGGYIIIGYTCSYGDNNYDFYLIKTDANGYEEWNQTFEGAYGTSGIQAMGFRSGMSVREITDGYILTGITDTSYGGGLLDIFLIKTDDDGNEIWNQTYGGENDDEGYWINVTSDSGYILSGATTSYGTGTIDGWLIKTDSNGDEIWNKTFGESAPGNDPPNKPSIPDGPVNGITGVDYIFNTSTEDPNGDDVYYLFDWGDGSNSGWVGPYNSGQKGNASHKWDDKGDYNIKAKAKDEYDEESDWSQPLTIHIVKVNNPPYKPNIKGQTKIKVGKEYEYTFSAIDPDDDNVSYNITWGDGEKTGWLNFVVSGTEIKLNHSWDKKGVYTIRCKARDIYYAESDWATLKVTVPKNKSFYFNFNPLSWLFERFPNAFQILRHLRGL